MPDGRLAYRVKKFRDGRAKHRVMTPLELLARLAALVPPPRYPLRKAPEASAASAVRGAGAWSRREPMDSDDNMESRVTREERPTVTQPSAVLAPARTNGVVLAPNILSVAHWDRLLGGTLYAATPRIEWATLLRRSFEVDVLACARCGGRLRVLGEVTEPSAVRLVLESLGLPTEAVRAARARDPTDLLAESAE